MGRTNLLPVREMSYTALAGEAQGTEHQPANGKVAGSIPCQGTGLGFRPGPQ